MAIDSKHFRELIVRPALQQMNMHSMAAENLVMGTAAQESRMGTYLKQIGSGPALGVFQMEPATYDDLWNNYILYRKKVLGPLNDMQASSMVFLSPSKQGPGPQQLVYNMKYAAGMCRVHYYRCPGALPAADDIYGLADYWKLYYNTVLGKGTPNEFVENYHRYVS